MSPLEPNPSPYAAAGRVLVTPRSVTRDGHPSVDRLATAGYEVVLGPRGRQPTEDELVRLVPDCVGYLAGVERITRRVLESAPKLRAISRNGAGTDNIDLAAARARGVMILTASGANARGVAELTIGLLFALARSLPECDARLKAGGWERRSGLELAGRTLGLAGCGRVGQLVAQLALGLGMRVVAYDAFPDRSFAPGPDFRFASWDEVLAQANFLSLHCPPADDGRPLLDASAVARIKPGMFLINTARYEVMDPEAVMAALDTGRIAGAALDVFDAEPPRDTRLLRHARVIATPHVGGFTHESIDRAMTVAVVNLVAALAK